MCGKRQQGPDPQESAVVMRGFEEITPLVGLTQDHLN
jgi:hypothetical protein